MARSVDLPGFCDLVPGGPGTTLGCKVVDKGVDAGVSGAKDAVLGQVGDVVKGLVAEVAKASADFVDRVVDLVNTISAPPIGTEWFTSVYESLWFPASMVIAVLLLVGSAWAAIRRNGSDLGHVLFGTFGAILAAAAAPFIVQGLLAIVDVASAHVASSVHSDVEAFVTRLTKMLGMASAGAPGIPTMGLALALLLFLVGAFGVVVELFLRSGAITVLLAVSPVIFAGLLLRGGTGLVRKATYVMLALIFSKLVIVTILTLGMAGLARAGTKGDSFTGLLNAGTLMLLAAFALPAVLRAIPGMDGGAAAPSRGEAARATGASKVGPSAQTLKGQIGKAGQTAGTQGAAKGAAAGGAAAGAATGGATAALAAAQKTAQAGKAKVANSPAMNGGPAGPATGAWTAPRHAKSDGNGQ